MKYNDNVKIMLIYYLECAAVLIIFLDRKAQGEVVAPMRLGLVPYWDNA